MFSIICDWIILIGAAIGAITAIYKFFLKPYVFFRNKRNKNIEEKEGVKDKLKEIEQTVKEIKEINLQQSVAINNMDRSTKDILRQRIMTIFHTYRHSRKMPLHIKEELDELFKDYKAQNGNNYIDKYYERMKKWEVIEDDQNNK